jgi:predicted cupin superfamily sugar epimerase
VTDRLIDELGLLPHPEGGWYRETWRSPVAVDIPGYDGPRFTATAIYFLLQPGEESRWHVVRSDELWLWHSGGPLLLSLGGSAAAPGPATDIVLGADIGRALASPTLAVGQRPQVVVPGGTWQSARPLAAESVLVSCVVSPGFDFADFRLLP